MKIKVLCLMILIVVVGVSGCGMEQNKMELKKANMYANVELTQRQKNILEEQGLSTEVNDLTVIQIKSIIAIEEILSYLENKYDKSFVYVGYTPASSLEQESLRACISGGDPQFDSFDVKRTEDGYEDDYMLVAIRDDYTNYIEELLKSELKNESLRLFAQIYTTELTELPEDKEDYLETVSSWKAVFMYLPEKEEAQMTQCAQEIEQILRSKKIKYDCEVVFLKENILHELTAYNYMDYLTSQYYEKRQTIEID